MSRGIPGSTPGHGTVAQYSAGCRCDRCRAAAARRGKRNRVALLRGYPGLLPYIVVTRRIHALAAIGWTYDDLAPRLGVTGQNVGYLASRSSGMVQRGIAHRVIRLYDELSMTPGPSNIARLRALSRGWAPPLLWDDDTIDDPNASPHDARRSHHARAADYVPAEPIIDEVAIARVLNGDRVAITKEERLIVVTRLAAQGWSDRQIAQLLGMTDRTIFRDRDENGIESRWAS